MQNTLLSLNVQLPLVIVDLIIEYKRHVEYAVRVWQIYSTQFMLCSSNTPFEQIFRNIHINSTRLGVDEEEMDRAVVSYGQFYNEDREQCIEEDIPIPFETFRQHQWNMGTLPSFEGEKYWLWLAIGQN